jgi:hypothetical protein
MSDESASLSDDQFDPSDDSAGKGSTRTIRKPMPARSSIPSKRSQGKTFNPKHPIVKDVPTFDSQTSPLETERRLTQLFGPEFPYA